MVFHETVNFPDRRRLLTGCLLIGAMLLGTGRAYAQESVSLQQMIDRVIQTYPSIEIAALQVEQARQEFAKVKSTLGWKIYSQAGVSHDLSFIDSPTDRFDIYASMQRSLESGSQLEFSGQYAYEESDVAFSPFVPNPLRRSGVDIRYRMPFARGRDNVFYQESLANAEAGLQLEKASQVLGVDNLVQQAISIFFDAANAYQRLQDGRAAIERAERLKKYIARNYSLGLSEEKDILRIDAQLNGAISRYEGIELSWKALRNELNRLMNYPAGTELELIYSDSGEYGRENRDQLLQAVYQRNPNIAIQQALADIALTNINITRDRRKEQLDLVLSAGARYGSGSTATGSYSQDEVIGSAALEYRFDLDQQGFDAEYYQSLLRYEAANKEAKLAKHDLQYALDNLIEQLEVGRRTVRTYSRYVALEEKKLAEAMTRYREGRATTNELVDFENDLNISLFAYNNQKIEVTRVLANIQLLLGELWDRQVLETPVQNNKPEAFNK